MAKQALGTKVFRLMWKHWEESSAPVEEVWAELEGAAKDAQACADQIAMNNKLGKWAPKAPESASEEKGDA